MALNLIRKGFPFQRTCLRTLFNSHFRDISNKVLTTSCCDQPVSNFWTSFSTSPNSSNVNANIKEVSQTDENEILYRAIDILIKGHEPSVLESFMTFMLSAAEHLDIYVAGKLKPKFIADRSTFLKSIHVHKKHRVQYEIRTHRRVLQLKYMTGSTANVYLEYIERNIPAGVAMHVHKWQIQQIPEHIQERMKENIELMSADDWEQQAQFFEKMKQERLTTNADYEEYQTTKRFLLGTVF